MNRHNRLFVIFLFIAIMVLEAFSFASNTFAQNKKNVLILNSYHQGYKWSDEETQGAIEALAPMKNDLNIYIEYMGSKWISDDQYYEKLHQTLKYKYRSLGFDVIILSDNDALNFMIKYRDDIVGKVPTVFCGINYFTDDDLKGQPLYTGVNETANVKGTLEIALRFHPSTKKVIVINDTTITGRRLHDEITKVMPAFQDKVRFEFLEDIEMETLLERVEKLSPDSLILYTIFSRDKKGKFYEYDESMSLIAQRSKVPIYGTWDFSLGYGIIGGLLTSGYDQGRGAGEMVLRILHGEGIENIPVVRQSPNRYMFDYQQMERFKIKRSDLPQESVVINEPVSFYALNKEMVWGIIAGITGLIFAVIILLVNVHRRKEAEHELRKGRDELEMRVQERTAELLKTTIVLQQEIAEHKEAREALLEGEQKLYSIIQGSFIPSFVIGRDHTILYWNRALEELSRLNAEEMVGTKKHWQAFYREERPCMADLLVDQSFETISQWYRGKYSKSKLLEEAYEATDFFPELGEHGIWLRFTAAAIRNFQGELIGAVETLEDITDQKFAEEKLKESQQQLADIINFLPDATLVIDTESMVIAWNRAIEDMTGVKSENMLGKGNYEYALPFYGERRPVLIDLVLKPQKDVEEKYLYVERHDGILIGESHVPALKGKEAFLLGTAGALRNSKGDIVGSIMSIRDITDKRRVEEALVQAEEKYRSIYENAIEGIFQTTRKGRIIEANPAFAHILGYDSPEEVMNAITDLSAHLYVDPERQLELLRNLDEQKIMRNFEVEYYRKDKSKGWFALNVRVIHDKSGKVINYEGTIQDISDRKLMEARLRQSQKIEAIGTLAGGIAHDFNNILAAIIGYTEMAQDNSRPEKQRYYHEQVLHASDRAKKLVSQILAFSRQADKEIKPIDVGVLIKEALKMIRATLPSTIEIRSNIGRDVDAVLADPTQIHQIMMNLCTNAAHAMREKGGILEIGLTNALITSDMLPLYPDLNPGSYVKFTVGDTGTGIEPEVMDRIFDPFFTTKKRGEGTGLGLSVVYGIIKEYGGMVTVQSKPGEGSTFIIYLPVAAQVEKLNKDESIDTIPRGSERVLFIDDENVLAEIGKDILEELGYTVIATSSSTQALEIFHTQPDRIDLVITDMTMPVMTGADLAKEILKIRPDIPIILCTGFSEVITEGEAKRMGIKEFLMKPLTLRDIAVAARKVLDRKED
ncbi:MAG: ABC transporter substrate binding protein [Syntrophaceae bacterium]